MTYGEILPIRARSEDQCGRGAHEGIWLSSPNRQRTRRPVSDLVAPSVPICATRTDRWGFGSYPGTETRFYGEAATQPDSGDPAACRSCRSTSRRHRRTGFCSLSGREWGAWLARAPAPGRSNWNTSSTDCLLFESMKRTACSSRAKSGVAAAAAQSRGLKREGWAKRAIDGGWAVKGLNDGHEKAIDR